MSCCSSSSITPCTISVNDALSLLDGVGNNCGSLCNYSISTSMPPSPIPQYSSVIEVEENNISKGFFTILNFWATGASTLTVTAAGGGQADILINTDLVERVLWSESDNLRGSGSLIPGKLYWIYDIGDALTTANGGLNPSVSKASAYAGIILKALDIDKFDSVGAYIARVPNRSAVSFWSNTVAYPTAGIYVEHMNYVYVSNNVQASTPYSTPPSARPADWTVVPKNDFGYYDTNIYSCIYDQPNNQIISITDNSDNTLTLSNITGKTVNEPFLYCFRWGVPGKVFSNKITISGLTNSFKGFVAGTSYPLCARSFTGTGAGINFNFSDWEFSNNNISMVTGKGPAVFNSTPYTATFYSSFYSGSGSSFISNTVYNCVSFINDYIIVTDSSFDKCSLGTTTLNIIGQIPSGVLGTIDSCSFSTVLIRKNTGQISRCKMNNCTIGLLSGSTTGNTELFLTDVIGSVNITDNASSTIQNINALTRVEVLPLSATNSENKIRDNNGVIFNDISGHNFDIRQNTRISIYNNVRLYNAKIRYNTATATPILFDTDGTTVIPIVTGQEPLRCAIIQAELTNFSRIDSNTWNTSGAISRVSLNGSDIVNMVIDFRDSAWIAAGTPLPPATPPATPTMLVGGKQVYLIQNRCKLASFDSPGIINTATGSPLTIINGYSSNALVNTTLPALNAYTYSLGAWNPVPIISYDTPYANASYMTAHESSMYVFLNIEEGYIYNAGTKQLTIPDWACHASIIYLYSTSASTITIKKIQDQSNSIRSIYNFRLISLSDSLVVNIDTIAISLATSYEIVSGLAPGVGVMTLNNRFDVLEFEKRDNINYVTNYVNMQ